MNKKNLSFTRRDGQTQRNADIRMSCLLPTKTPFRPVFESISMETFFTHQCLPKL